MPSSGVLPASSSVQSSSHRSHLPPSSVASHGAEPNLDRILNTPKSFPAQAAEHQSGNIPKPVYAKASKSSSLRNASSDMQSLSANTVVGPPNSVISKSGPVLGGVSAPASMNPSAQIAEAVGASGESAHGNKVIVLASRLSMKSMVIAVF